MLGGGRGSEYLGVMGAVEFGGSAGRKVSLLESYYTHVQGSERLKGFNPLVRGVKSLNV